MDPEGFELSTYWLWVSCL